MRAVRGRSFRTRVATARQQAKGLRRVCRGERVRRRLEDKASQCDLNAEHCRRRMRRRRRSGQQRVVRRVVCLSRLRLRLRLRRSRFRGDESIWLTIARVAPRCCTAARSSCYYSLVEEIKINVDNVGRRRMGQRRISRDSSGGRRVCTDTGTGTGTGGQEGQRPTNSRPSDQSQRATWAHGRRTWVTFAFAK